MKYKKVSPLGPREGQGTYETFYSNEKYSTLQEAIKANDIAIVDFVRDENNTTYFEIYHSKHPDHKKYHRLNYQHFPAGVDMLDDSLAVDIVDNLFKENERLLQGKSRK